MVAANVAHAADVAPVIMQLLQDVKITRLHLHNAKLGCSAARRSRVSAAALRYTSCIHLSLSLFR